VQWGLCAEGCSSLTFTRILGRQKAAALILAGQRMTAAELESAGLVTKILPPENFLGDVLQIARGVAKLPRESLRTNKELMVGRWRGELLEANEVEMRMLKEQARKGESREAIAGFARETERKRREKQQGAKL
jgi:peroxisomal 3,2-trans-enoyl-CoA isomerase